MKLITHDLEETKVRLIPWGFAERMNSPSIERVIKRVKEMGAFTTFETEDEPGLIRDSKNWRAED